MIGQYILDDEGNPILCNDLIQWGQWMESADRTVARDEYNGVQVSTVFLGLDHSFGRGEPVLWETMVFGGPLDQEQQRYTSRVAAVEGHQHLCYLVQLEQQINS